MKVKELIENLQSQCTENAEVYLVLNPSCPILYSIEDWLVFWGYDLENPEINAYILQGKQIDYLDEKQIYQMGWEIPKDHAENVNFMKKIDKFKNCKFEETDLIDFWKLD